MTMVVASQVAEDFQQEITYPHINSTLLKVTLHKLIMELSMRHIRALGQVEVLPM